MKTWPFKIVPDDEYNRPVFEVTFVKDKKSKTKVTKRYHPQEISGLVLKTMRESAKKVTENLCKKCVVTIPAYFMKHQIEATKEACKIAGLDS